MFKGIKNKMTKYIKNQILINFNLLQKMLVLCLIKTKQIMLIFIYKNNERVKLILINKKYYIFWFSDFIIKILIC